MSRPGNTTHVTDSTDSGSTSEEDAATTEGRSDRGQPRPAGQKTLGCRQQPNAHELSYRVPAPHCWSYRGWIWPVRNRCSRTAGAWAPRATCSSNSPRIPRRYGPRRTPGRRPDRRAGDHGRRPGLRTAPRPGPCVDLRLLTSVPGIAEPGRMMLRLEFGEAYVDDLWGAEDIEAEDFRDAAPIRWSSTRRSCSSIWRPPTASRCGPCADCWASATPAPSAATRPGRAGRPGPLRAAGAVHREPELLLRRPLRVPRAGARRHRAAPCHAHPLRGGAL